MAKLYTSYSWVYFDYISDDCEDRQLPSNYVERHLKCRICLKEVLKNISSMERHMKKAHCIGRNKKDSLRLLYKSGRNSLDKSSKQYLSRNHFEEAQNLSLNNNNWEAIQYESEIPLFSARKPLNTCRNEDTLDEDRNDGLSIVEIHEVSDSEFDDEDEAEDVEESCTVDSEEEENAITVDEDVDDENDFNDNYTEYTPNSFYDTGDNDEIDNSENWSPSIYQQYRQWQNEQQRGEEDSFYSTAGEFHPENNRLFSPLSDFKSKSTKFTLGYIEDYRFLAWDYDNHWSRAGLTNNQSLPNEFDKMSNNSVHRIVDEFCKIDLDSEAELYLIRKGHYLYYQIPLLVSSSLIDEWERFKKAYWGMRCLESSYCTYYEFKTSCKICYKNVSQVIAKDCMHWNGCSACFREQMEKGRQPYKCIICSTYCSYIGLAYD